MPYIIAEPCIGVKDKACVEVCPVDCIYEGDTMLFIHPEECIDCGACEPVCPVKAIFAEDETPDQWKNYIELNKQFFKDHPESSPRPRTSARLRPDRQRGASPQGDAPRAFGHPTAAWARPPGGHDPRQSGTREGWPWAG